MKRGGPLNPGKGFGPRRARLNPGVKQLRRAALNRSSELSRAAATRKPMVAKRQPVTAEERHARKVVRARSGGMCEVCGRAPATNFQHRQGKAQMGAWTVVNGLDVCGMGNVSGCHGAIHQSPALAYERGWSVRSTHDPAEVAVWLAGRGWSYLRPDGSVAPVSEGRVA